MKWFLYILECKDNSLYTGISINIDRRIWQHNNKKGAISLRCKLPVKLVYQEEFDNHKDAAKREKEIKAWKREKKIKLISKI